MKSWHVVLAVVGLNYLLWLGLSEIGNRLSAASVGLHFDVLLILFPALFLPAGPSLAICVFISLIVGVHRPVSIGATLTSIFALWQLALWMRVRLRRDHLGHIAGLAAALQALIVLVWSLAMSPSSLNGSIFWIRAGTELLVSAALVAMLAGWWCRWQVDLLEEFGWSEETN